MLGWFLICICFLPLLCIPCLLWSRLIISIISPYFHVTVKDFNKLQNINDEFDDI